MSDWTKIGAMHGTGVVATVFDAGGDLCHLAVFSTMEKAVHWVEEELDHLPDFECAITPFVTDMPEFGNHTEMRIQ